MPNWKKVITSGSNASLNQITASAFQFLGSGNAELEVQGHITASGNISASGTILASVYKIDDFNAITTSGTELLFGNANNWTQLTYGRQDADAHKFIGNITASGNISASGVLISSASIKTGLDRLVAYDTSTGQFHITASSGFHAAGGGGGASALDDLSDVDYSSGDLTISSLDKLVVGDFEIDSSGDITLNADGGDISFKDNTDTLVEITNNADTGSIYVSGSIEFSPNDIRPSVSGSTLYNYNGTRAGTDNPTLEYNGIPVGPKQFEMITGAMSDDISTSKIYLPLNNNFESTVASDEMGIVAPCSGSVKSFTCRIGGSLNGDVTFAVTFEKAFPGGSVSSPSVADSQDIDLAGTNDNDSFAVVFDNDAVVGPGEVMYFAIQGSADRSSTLNYFFTVVMEWDYSTLPNADTIYA